MRAGTPSRGRLQRRAFATLAGLLTLLVACRRADPPAPTPPPFRPNLLIICIDALRADHVGLDGYALPTTPHIDALAEEGVFFAAGLAHTTWTKPSIATLMTSLYPSQHGIQRVALGPEGELRTEVLDESLVTLAERLRDAGYVTGASINQVHLSERFGFAQGFDFFHQPRGHSAFKLNRRLDDWLRGLPGDRPFFAYLHYLDLHWPFNVRLPESGERFGSTAMKEEPPKKGAEVPAWGAQLDDEDDLRALVARYDHEVAYSDAGVGDMVERLRAAGLYEDTLIIVTSDHGEAFLEHAAMGHGMAPYEELMRIPLVVRLPQPMRAVGGGIDTPVGLIDVMPTLLEIAGAAPEAQAQGQSFAPLLRDQPLPARVIFGETHDALVARTETHKLIRFTDGRTEFYDLTLDPAERAPIDEPCTGPCRELARALEGFSVAMQSVRESSAAGTAELSEEELESLRSLGYLN